MSSERSEREDTSPVAGLRAEAVGARITALATRWRLTQRQQEVLSALVLSTGTNKELAASLGCAEVTIERHLRGIYAKAGLPGRLALLAAVLRATPPPRSVT